MLACSLHNDFGILLDSGTRAREAAKAAALAAAAHAAPAQRERIIAEVSAAVSSPSFPLIQA